MARRGPASPRRGGRRALSKSSPKIARRRGNAVAMSAQTGGVGQFSRRGGTYHGFKSKKQWRWAFASKQPWAHEKAHRTKGGPKVRYRRLPASKHSGHKGSRVPS